jgi:GDP-4-dehydro-6-deoxy-D-mannose reductase
MTTLVTGASGFLAAPLCARLRREGAHVTGSDVRAPGAGRTDAWHGADLLDAAAAEALVRATTPTTVYHLVGAVRGDDALVHATNVTTTQHLLRAVQRHAPAARVVVVGSAAEYGSVPAASQPVTEAYVGAPTSAYGRAKCAVTALATAAVREGLAVLIARPFNVIGAGVPPTLVVGAIVARLQAALAGASPRAITVGPTSAVRDFIDVEDVVAGLHAIARLGTPGEAYNLCSGAGHQIVDVLARLLALAEAPVEVQADATLAAAGVDALIGSHEKATRALDWRPVVSLDMSLRAAWASAAAVVA